MSVLTCCCGGGGPHLLGWLPAGAGPHLRHLGGVEEAALSRGHGGHEVTCPTGLEHLSYLLL